MWGERELKVWSLRSWKDGGTITRNTGRAAFGGKTEEFCSKSLPTRHSRFDANQVVAYSSMQVQGRGPDSHQQKQKVRKLNEIT